MSMSALRALLFYGCTAFCSLALLDCTIIGDDPEGLDFEKTEILKIGKLSSDGSFMIKGRIQIVRVQNEDEPDSAATGSDSKVHLEFSSDFNITASAPDTDDLTVFLSAGSSS